MADVSFDKNIVINEPASISGFVEALISGNVRKIDKKLASSSETVRSEQKLEQYLSHFKN